MSSIHEVAREAGVSTATVSRTFGAPNLLSKRTRQRVLEVAERLNYRPRRSNTGKVGAAAGRRPARPAHDFIGFQFFASSESDTIQANAFYAPVLAGAQAEAALLGMHLILHTTNRLQLSQELPKMVREQAVAGILLVGIGAADPEILDLFRGAVPLIVLVDNHDSTGRYDCILSDGFGGTMTATNSLFERGHRRVGFLLPDPKVTTFQDRLHGYLCAHYDAGVPLDPRLVLSADYGAEGYTRLADFLQSPERPSALIAANDLGAFAVLQVCRSLGIDIPGDLSLIGFDDLDFSSHTYPSLTTVRVEKEYLGRLAVRRLYRRLHADEEPAPAEPPVQLITPVSLIQRNSCRALRGE